MAALKDTGAKLRLDYFVKMSDAEDNYDSALYDLKKLVVERSALHPQSAKIPELDRRISWYEKDCQRYLAEFTAYATALAAISTAVVS